MTIQRPAPAPAPAAAALPPRPGRLPSLTGLRFFAAFLVVLSHVGVNLLPRVAPDEVFVMRLFYEAGAFGVSFFFILSGFVLTWVARDDDPVGRFWRRRFFKIYPNHLVTFLAALLLAAGAGHALTGRDAGATLLLVQTWIPDMKLQFNLWSNTPTWSLSCELLFYLSFPWLLRLLRRIPAARLWPAFFAVYAAIWAVPLVASWLPASGGIHPGTQQNWYSMWFMTFFPPVRMLEFVLGIVTALIVANGRWIRLPLPVALLFPLVPFVAEGKLPNELGFVALTALPLAFMIASAAASDVASPTGRTWLGSRTMVFLGEISFALYLVHWLVVVYGWIGRSSPALTGRPPAPATWPEVLGLAGLTIAVSLVLAWLLYVLVERPAMRWWSRPRDARTGVRAPAADKV
ncbi:MULTISPECIES: acyltransferase [unclassified Streptomyces]|uniref:acyltransferase family protein n=1 Tax=unclassified Streptomyces TaxID=2593676 RepID=UPI000690B05C